MRNRFLSLAVVFFTLHAALAGDSPAQTLASRVGSSADRVVTFSYAARPGVCGDGRTYISTRDNFVGTYSTSTSYEQCQPGPVRVVVDLADRTVIALRAYVGGAGTESGVTDLGTVHPAEAAGYLISVAARADGRVGRDAIFAASLGENVEVSGKLLDIARDTGRPLETRTAALSALRRSDGRQMDRIGGELIQIARNEDDAQRIRSHALSVLSSLEHGGGIQPLIELANSSSTSWIARESMRVLSRSGDPRARQFLRAVVQRTDLSDEVLATAIGGLGGSYVTGQDAALLRSIYPRLTGRESQNKVLSAIANLGGSENVRWLMAIARDEKQPLVARRRAISALSRDSDPAVRQALQAIVER